MNTLPLALLRRPTKMRGMFHNAPLSIFLLAAMLSGCQAQSDTTTEVESTAAPTVAAADTSEYPMVHVYKSPGCMCCVAWADHLRAAGFDVEVTEHTDLVAFKEEHGIPREHASCHTAVVGDYVVEGHVPADDVKRMLDEEPDAVGLAVPAMPVGSPGMEMPNHPGEAYDVLLVEEDGSATVYEHYAPESSN